MVGSHFPLIRAWVRASPTYGTEMRTGPARRGTLQLRVLAYSSWVMGSSV